MTGRRIERTPAWSAPPSLATLPSLHALRCFDVAARTESFSRAAAEMALTHGAVSRQIRGLEDALGIALFERRGRNVVLAPSGRALAETTSRAFALLAEGIAAVAGGTDRPIVLSCEPTLALAWLIPRLGAFEAEHPDLVVHLDASGGPVDFERRGIDLAVRRLDFALGDAVASVPLVDEWIGPVCAPAVRARVAKAPRLQTRTRLHAFRDWEHATGLALAPARTLTFDHFAFSLEAASAGLGVAIGPYPLVVDALASGALVAPFGFVRGPVGYGLLAPVRSGVSQRDATTSEHGDADAKLGRLRAWLGRVAKKAVPPPARRFDATAQGNVSTTGGGTDKARPRAAKGRRARRPSAE